MKDNFENLTGEQQAVATLVVERYGAGMDHVWGGNLIMSRTERILGCIKLAMVDVVHVDSEDRYRLKQIRATLEGVTV